MTESMWQFDPYVRVNGLVINGLRHVPIFLEGPVGVQMFDVCVGIPSFPCSASTVLRNKFPVCDNDLGFIPILSRCYQ